MRLGTDDLENKRIYEESVHPEGIRKTIKLNEDLSNLDFTRLKQSPNPLQRRKRKESCDHVKIGKEQLEIIFTIVFIVVFMLIFFSIMV